MEKSLHVLSNTVACLLPFKTNWQIPVHFGSVCKRSILAVILLVSFFTPASAQLTGTKTIPGDYATVTAAVTALNAVGVGTDGVIFNIAANYTETLSAATPISITATGTAANTIIFQKDPLTIGANPLITAYTGGTGTPATATQDGIWRLLGSDYITINSIDLVDNAANTTNPSTMEYGYALYKTSATNGCQFVSIINCVITLNRINNAAGTVPMTDGSTGILSVNSTATAATTVITVTSSAGTNSNNIFYNNTIQNCNTGIALIGYAAATPFSLADQYNDIGGTASATGNKILNFGGAASATVAAVAIRTLAQYNLNVSYNTINNNNGAGINHETTLRGIYINTATSAASDITNNIITLKSGATTSQITAIENASGSSAVGNEVKITNNTITNCTYTTATTGSFYGIYNSATAAILTITDNSFTNNSTAATATGVYYAIFNAGTVVNTININNNNISGVTFSAATSAPFTGIINTGGAATASLSISNNNFSGINYAALSTAANTYITNGAATLSQVISSNTFTSLNVNTTGAITFISNSVILSATGNQVVDDNSIVGTFTRTATAASGALTLFTSTASNATGSVISNSNNDFSNITVSGAATIAGWINTDAGSSLKTIQGNIFSNWTGGAGAITALTVNLTGAVNATVSNEISNITSAGSITGISTGAGNDNIYSNIISNLSSTGGTTTTVTGIYVSAATIKNIYQNTISGLTANSGTTGNTTTLLTVNGIWVAGGTTVNIYENKISALTANAITTGTVNAVAITGGTTVSAYRNKIYTLSSSSTVITSGGVNGVRVSGSASGTSVTIRNNIIGDLKTTAASIADPIRGINLISTGAPSSIYVYYNTIYLNAVSSGTNFGSTGIYHAGNTTATTAKLEMINNIIFNISTPNGTGLTVAYRRSSTNLSNYGSTSNNNLFYAGTPAANKLIFTDGTNSDQTLAAFKTRMSTRDAASVTENLVAGAVFLSTTGSSLNYLHIDDTKTTVIKSGGINISGVTLDFDNDIRFGNAGYAGTGTAPDIGADEYAGISYLPLAGNYNVGTGQTFTTLTSAGGLFAKINRVGLSGNVTVSITSDLAETGLEALNEWTETGAGNYNLIIQPNNNTLRLISGDVLQGLIRLNGANRVTIDGAAGKYLTFRNTNTAGTTGTAITFINGATNNIIRNCNLEAFTDINNGVLLFSTSATFTGGNSDNLVEHCNINGTVGANNAVVCVLSAGTNVAGFENSNNIISNNEIYNFRDRGLGIKSTGSNAWTITGNSFYNGSISSAITYASGSTLHGIRILGGAGYAVTNNYIGGSAALATGSNAVYATAAGNVSYQGILLNTSSAIPESNIKGNTIAKINITSFPIAASSTAFIGIETNGSGINIGGTVTGEGNLVGSNSTNSSVVATTSTATATFTTNIWGIFCNSRNGAVIGNQVGGIDIKNIGAAPAPSTFLGIYVNNPTAPTKVNNNIIGSNGAGAATNSIQVLSTSTATTTSLTGISIGTSVGSALQLDSNIIKNISHLSTAVTVSAGGITGINTAAKNTAEIIISNNSFTDNTSSSTMTTGLFYGIQNTGASSILKINNNFIAGNTIASTTTVFNAIRNAGVVFNIIEINGNAIGSSTIPAANFSAANSGAHILINNTGGSSAVNLSINNNDIQNINYTGANGTGTNTYISNTAATLSQSINNNSFTNINTQTAGSATFISNSVIVPAGGYQNINNNFIAGTYSKKAGGTVTGITSTATCAAGSTVNINNNNFSNITLTGATTLTGLVNTDAGSSFKTIQGNTFYKWVCGTAAVTPITVNLTGSNATSGNIVRNISSAGAITGIATAGNDNINNNTIDSLFSTGGTTTIVSGINVTAGTTKNIYQNTISNLQGNSLTTGSVRGILISGGTAVNFYQNVIYGLTANALTTGSVSGAWVSGGSTVNIYRNKIYDISSAGSAMSGQLYGIVVSGATASLTCTINNNTIGDLRATVASNIDAIRGIGVLSTGLTSTTNVYYNTIYLNASSTGTNFGTSGIFHTASATATTSALNLINNSISNLSVFKGSGFVVAYRRSIANLTNYGASSNNNMFYAGTPAARYLIFYDGTNSDQTIAAFKTRVAARDAASISEDLITGSTFLSTAGSTVSFLHIDPNKTTALRSAGINISGFTDDFDGDIRFGNSGYAGNGTAPDIGADEFAGLQFLPFSGIVNVGIGQNYTSLTNSNGIFGKINSLGLSGHVTINIVSDLAETGAEALNQWSETGAGNYTIKIQPDASTARLISGNVVAGMIRFNGPDRVKVDGGTNRLLTFRNTNTTGTTGTAFTFINAATYDTIRYCNIEAYANANNGVVLFGTAASGATGNSNNLLEYNNINGTYNSNSSLVSIYSAGTTGKSNSANVISNNKIYDYRDRAIDITATGSTGWTISNNSFYNGDAAAVVNYPASSELHGIRILGGSGYSISNNYFGGNAALAAGTIATYASNLGNIGYQGILLTTTSASPASNIKGNTIAKISVNYTPVSSSVNAFTGIETNGSGISIGGSLPGEGNLVGSNTANGSIAVITATIAATYTSTIKGINCLSNGGIVTGNQVGGFDITNSGIAPAASAFTGIYINNATAPTQVNTNTIGSTITSNSIRVISSSTALTNTISGIELGSAVASAVLLNANIIQNIANLSTTSSGSFTGINNTAVVAGAVITISNNHVSNITSAANGNVNSTIYTGISSSSPSTISNDTITDIAHLATGTAAQIRGITVKGAFIHTINGNIVSGLSTASTKVADVESVSAAVYTITGILNLASVAGQEIYSNTLSAFSSTTTDITNTAVTGIGIGTAGFSGNIYKNRIVEFTNTSTGTSTLPGITGIDVISGTGNVYNNVIKFTNAANSNGLKLFGLNHSASTAWNYYYNTVSIGGAATGTATRSAAFIRTVNGAVILKNNLLINTRTGTGSHYSISNKVASPATNWPAGASDFNDLYSSTAGTTGEWGNGSNNTFLQWQTNSGGDASSVNRSVSFVVSTYDLRPDPNSNCAINNSATVISSPLVINTDIDGVNRNATTPDMGAYEFTYTAFIVTASSNAPVCSGNNVNLFTITGMAISPSYSWSDPAHTIISNLQNPTVTAVVGNYTVTVTDINGCAVPDSTAVSFIPAPATTISYTGSPYCGNQGIVNITFSGTTGGTFSSTAGLSINATTGAVTLAGSLDGTYTVTYTITGGCLPYSDSTYITVKALGKWLGTSNTDWNNTANWQCAVVPTATNNVVIAGGLTYYPIISTGTSAVNNLTIQSGATLSVTAATLQIAGTVTNSGTFTATGGTIELNGISAQVIPAIAYNNLTLSGGNTKTLSANISITNTLLPGANTTLALDNYDITLRSTATTIARIGNTPVSANITYGTGRFIVQRYVPGRRKYRLFTSSVTSSANNTLATGEESLSIWGNWQNSGNNVTQNIGTIITGGSAADGFDQQTTSASMFTYDDVNRAFVGYTSINGKNTKYTPLKAGKAYFLFVYGDRTNTITTTTPKNTTISSRGKVLMGDQVYTTSSTMPLAATTDRFTMLGNPFASPIDWATVSRTNISNTFWGWDPNLNSTGGYVTVNTTGTVTIISPYSGTVGLNQYIQPGQGFFVKTTAAAPAMTIKESDKVPDFNSIAFFTEPAANPVVNNIPLLAINLLYNVSNILADGAVAAFDNSFSNTVGTEDASKLLGAAEVLAIQKGADLLSIDARKMPLNKDTIFINIQRITKPRYILEIFANQMTGSTLSPFLEDTYLNTSLALSLSDTNRILFGISSAVPASYSANRFRIVFHDLTILPVTFRSVKASQKGSNNQVEWSVAEESTTLKYQIEHSVNGTNFTLAGDVNARGVAGTQDYQWLHIQPAAGNNFYRIKAINADGKFVVSNIVQVKNSSTTSSEPFINVFPNPVTNLRLNILLDDMPKGRYPVQIMNVQGQVVFTQNIDHNGGSASQVISIPKTLAAGMYFIQVINGTARYTQSVKIN